VLQGKEKKTTHPEVGWLQQQNAACLVLTQISSQTILRAVCLMSVSLTAKKYQGSFNIFNEKKQQIEADLL
jgi:hypothetical protein